MYNSLHCFSSCATHSQFYWWLFLTFLITSRCLLMNWLCLFICFALMLPLFFAFALSCDDSGYVVKFSDVYEWQYECDPPNLSDNNWKELHCTASNTWKQTCNITIKCTGNRTFVRDQWCPNVKGASYGRALLFTYIFGMFGVDRFYLGYTSIGFMKLFTGGFFFIGYLFDCILITCQIIKPADGSGYAATNIFPFLIRDAHRDIF